MYTGEFQHTTRRPVAVLHQLFPICCLVLWCQGHEDQPHPHDSLLRFSGTGVALLTGNDNYNKKNRLKGEFFLYYASNK
jgi:hypothetical protein